MPPTPEEMPTKAKDSGLKTLDPGINYVVSGLERSGTSLMMQMLSAGGLPLAFDDLRRPDEHNPRGYFELEGGKIITRLMHKTFPMETYRGRFLKITAFGLLYLPPGKYKIIYMQRDLDEILDSMEKMAKTTDPQREETKRSFHRLNAKVLQDLHARTDVDLLLINFNEILRNPSAQLQEICQFLQPYPCDYDNMLLVIDQRLYRQRR